LTNDDFSSLKTCKNLTIFYSNVDQKGTGLFPIHASFEDDQWKFEVLCIIGYMHIERIVDNPS
jgi:hypothetical protein